MLHEILERTEVNFKLFYENVLKDSSSLTEEPKPPRNLKAPRRFDDEASPHCYHVIIVSHLFEVLDLVVGEVEGRYDQSDPHHIHTARTDELGTFLKLHNNLSL